MHDSVDGAHFVAASVLVQPTYHEDLVSVKRTLNIPHLQDMSCISAALGRMTRGWLHHALGTTNLLGDLCNHQQTWAMVLLEKTYPVQLLHQAFQCFHDCDSFEVPACAQRYKGEKAIASY